MENSLTISILKWNVDDRWETIYQNQLVSLGNSPTTIRFPVVNGQHFRLTLTKNEGARIFRLSEIEFSHLGHVTSSSAKITSSSNQTIKGKWILSAINDGFASRGQIIPDQTYLKELSQRQTLSKQIFQLNKKSRELQTKINNRFVSLLILTFFINTLCRHMADISQTEPDHAIETTNFQ